MDILHFKQTVYCVFLRNSHLWIKHCSPYHIIFKTNKATNKY